MFFLSLSHRFFVPHRTASLRCRFTGDMYESLTRPAAQPSTPSTTEVDVSRIPLFESLCVLLCDRPIGMSQDAVSTQMNLPLSRSQATFSYLAHLPLARSAHTPLPPNPPHIRLSHHHA